jgi:hypothetical protein
MAGIHYANEDSAGTCSRCGRVLTDPASIAAGIGPECAEQDAADREVEDTFPVGAGIRITDANTTSAGLTGTVAGYARKRGKVESLVLQVTDHRGWTYLERRKPAQVERIEVAS